MTKKSLFLFHSISSPMAATRWFGGFWRGRLERNPGDMVYAFSVMNALAVSEEVDFQTTGYYLFNGYSNREIGRINQNCKAFIIPLADFFSAEWAPSLPVLTELIRKLRIPCVVPSVGVRGIPGGDWGSLPFNGIVRDFVRAVLDHSAILGVRGESTARYLEFLGFREGDHFRVLGCPTLPPSRCHGTGARGYPAHRL